MKKRLLLLTISLIFHSCVKENDKSDFIGNWSSTSDTNFNIDLQFFKDSLVHNNETLMVKESAKWKVIKNKIYQTFEKENSPEKVNVTLDYKFSHGKDTLYIKRENDSLYIGVFKKIKNSFEYLENKIGFELKLTDTNEKIIPISNNDFGFNIYIGKQKDTILIKTDENWGKFGGLERQILDYCCFKNESEIDSLKLNLFVDKSVNVSELDSIKSILRGYPVKRFFRIYNNKEYTENDWKAEINWLGKYEH